MQLNYTTIMSAVDIYQNSRSVITVGYPGSENVSMILFYYTYEYGSFNHTTTG
jgi:hypothetical protein